MRAGDVMFFTGKDVTDVEDHLNIAGQWFLTRQRRQWTHVAISIYGPLVVHSMPDGGVHFSVLEEDFLKDTRYTIARPSAAQTDPLFKDKIEKASLYWAGEKYAILGIYRKYWDDSAMTVGESFCSYVVQKIFSHMQVEPFGKVDKPLAPTQVFNELASHPSWNILEAQSLVPEGESQDKAFVQLCAKIECRRLMLAATAGVAGGQMTIGAKYLGDLALLVPFMSHLSAREKMKELKKTLAPLKQIGYETNNFLRYRNFLPILLSSDDDNVAPENGSWLFRDMQPAETADRSTAIRQAVDFEDSQLRILNSKITTLLAAFQQAPAAEQPTKAATIVSAIATYFDAIGAEELLEAPIGNAVASMEADLLTLLNCALPEFAEERTLFAGSIQVKIGLLKSIDRLAAAAGVVWPPALLNAGP